MASNLFRSASIFIAGLALGGVAWAAGTPDPGTAVGVLSTAEDQLFSITGEGDITANGDFVSATAGLNQPYDFFIEVPPGQARLQVDLFDIDIGGGGGAEFFDTQVGPTWNTQVVIALFQPDGTLFNAGATTTCGICDNVWLSPGIFNVANPQPGHWLLRVDQAIFTGGNGNDENAFGIRAHDGDATAGGTEYPVYALSYVGLGERVAAATAVNREYDLYPYVTRGCSMSIRDFDADGAGDWRLDTRAGVNLSTGPATLSGNDNWNTNAFSGWTSDLDATDYGLFHFFFEGTALAAGTNNVYTVYFGNDAAAGTPPTAQPEAETIRLYLPADGSTWSGNGTVGSGAGSINTPVQPYVGHVWAPIVNAPVRIGATTRIRVTVTVTNPTAQPMQFDTVTGGTRVLTATVPTNGGPTVLVGGSAAGPGAVAEAGAGPWTVTWAPGVVAAGATATLTYDIDVTPPAAGTLQFTGDPAGTLGAGTVATYLDGTCANAGGGATVCTNAAQLASGTFTFGPLCQLEADVQMPTPAVIADLWAQPAASGRRVSWRSAAEAGVSTFQLHRVVDGVWLPVGDAVPIRPAAPQGSRYTVLDASPVASLADSLYGLVAEDTDGTVRRHGPYRPAGDAPIEAASALVPARSVAPRWPSARRIELPVTESGWQRVDGPALAAALGLASSAWERVVERHGLRLEHRGQPVAWSIAERQGIIGLEWYGLAAEADDPFVAEAVYVLRLGAGLELDRIEPSTNSGSTLFADGFEDRLACAWNDWVGGPAPASCASEDAHRLEIEDDRHAVVIAPLDPEGDIWFQHLLFARHPTFGRIDESLAVPMALASGEPTLTLRLQGGSEALHRVRVEADGVALGSIELSGLGATAATFALPTETLADGVLDVTVEVEDGGWVFVDGAEIEHRRRLIATAGQLVVDAEHDGPLTIEGLGVDARVIELEDADRPIEIPARRSTSPAGERAVFDAVAGRRYLAFDATGVRTVSPRPDPTVDLTTPPAGVDYLVIADSTLTRAAVELAALRQLDGATPWIVDIDDVHDTFAGGEADPRAVRDFLRHVVTTWSQPPRWVALVGTGTYDHRDRYGLASSRAEGSISPLLVSSWVDTPSLFPSDGALADLGGDGVPAMALGRIPARTPDELLAYVERLRRHRDAGPIADRRLLTLSDSPDGRLDFARDGERLGDDLGQPSMAGVPTGPLVFGAMDGSFDDDRDQLFEALADDIGVVAFLGHGGFDRLTSPGWLTSADLGRLTAPVSPVYLALTCHVALHGLPGYDALAEELVRAEHGAVAFFGPAWLSSHGEALTIGRDVLRRLAEQPTPTLGEAVRAALTAAAARGVSADQLLTFQLLGDPAVVPRVALPAEASLPEPGSDA